jgi:hypothetical protein
VGNKLDRCGSCRFWGTKHQYHDTVEDGEYRTCTAIIHDEDGLTNSDGDNTGNASYYHWLEPEKAETRANEVREFRKQHLAVVKDGSGYFAALRSKKDFGCMLFKEKTSD